MSTRTRRTCALLLVFLVTCVQGIVPVHEEALAAAGRWERLPIYGGEVKGLVSLPSTSSTVVATTWGRGAFRSVDGGQHWSEANTGIIIRQLGPAVAASDGALYVASYGDGVYRSTDGGSSWTAMKQGLETGVVWIAVSPTSATTLYAASGGSHVFVTTDKGEHWTRCGDLPAGSYVASLAVAPGASSTVYVGTSLGILESTDSGAHWTPVGGLPGNAGRVTAIAFAGSALLAGTTQGVYRRASAGTDWVQADAAGTGGISVFAVEGGAGTVVYAGSFQNGVYRSADGGTTWISCGSKVGNLSVTALLAASSQSMLAGTEGSGVFRSSDGGLSWTPSSEGMTALRVSSLATKPGVPSTLVAGARGGVFTSTDAGLTWNNGMTGIYSQEVLSVGATESTIFAGMANTTAWFSADGGATWRSFSGWLNINDVRSWLAIGIPASTVYAGRGHGLSQSSDGGTTWTPMNLAGLSSSDPISALSVGPSPGIIYAGTAKGGIYRTTDSGTTWATTNEGLGDAHINGLSCIAGRMYALTNSGAYLLNESNTVWSALSPATSNRKTIAMVAHGNELFMAWENTVVRSVDNGQQWTVESTGLERTSITSLLVVGEAVYVGATDGVYRWSPGVNHRVGITLVGEALGASIEGPATVEVSDGQIATFKVNVNAGFEATVSHGSFSKETGAWTIPGVKGDVAAQMTLKRSATASFTAVLVIGNKTMLAGNQTVQLEAAPYIKGGRTMLPLRAISEAFGGDIEWDPAERKVTVKLGGHTVLLWIGKAQAEVDGKKTPIDANVAIVPEIVAGRTFVPLRFVAESTGLDVIWNADARSVTIRRA